jgi:hypothetical protein
MALRAMGDPEALQARDERGLSGRGGRQGDVAQARRAVGEEAEPRTRGPEEDRRVRDVSPSGTSASPPPSARCPRRESCRSTSSR